VRTLALASSLALALALALALVPLATASPEGDCDETAIGLVCVGDYAWTEGDGCAEAGKHEEGSGVWAETVAADASASGFTYCNVYGGYGYWEEGVRVRANTTVVFLEVSWNTWTFEEFDGPNDLGGCSLWVYYIGPVYGYYNNVGCPAGQEPPSEDWGHLFED
jgi:hypothetical protein